MRAIVGKSILVRALVAGLRDASAGSPEGSLLMNRPRKLRCENSWGVQKDYFLRALAIGTAGVCVGGMLVILGVLLQAPGGTISRIVPRLLIGSGLLCCIAAGIMACVLANRPSQ